MIKVNVGGVFHSLSKLSGGEASRVLLAMKTAFAAISPIALFIFDEIDSGVSGDVALRMAGLIQELSAKRQLLVITHLPIVAAIASHVLVVEKKFLKDQTQMSIKSLETESELEDTLALLLNQNPSEATREYIRQLRQKY